MSISKLFYTIAFSVVFLFSCNSDYQKKDLKYELKTVKSSPDKPISNKTSESISESVLNHSEFHIELNNTHLIKESDKGLEVMKTKDDLEILESLYNSFKKEPEVFYIKPDIDTVIVCKEGTKISIPGSVFVDEKGKLISGQVKIEVSEFLSKGDFLLANLSTSSDARMLESGGMLHIKASSNGRELRLKNKGKIGIDVPAKEILPDMELFYGYHDPHGQINWKNDIHKNRINGQRNINKKKPSLGVLGTEAMFSDKTGQIFLKDIDAHEWAERARKTEKIDSIEIFFSINSKGEVKINKTLLNNKRSYRKIRFSDFESRWDVLFNKSSNVNFKNDCRISADGSLGLLYTITENNVRSIKKKIKETQQPVDGYIKKIYCLKDTVLGRYNAYLDELEMQTAIDRRAKYLKLDSSERAIVKSTYYAFQSANLNWINVDRFYNSPRPKVDFVVKSENGKYADVKIVFNKINSVLKGVEENGNIRFHGVPLGENVTLVGIVIKDGSPHLAIQETTISKEIFNNLQFQKVTAEELKLKLKDI